MQLYNTLYMCLNMTMLEMEHVNMFSFKQRNIVTEKVTIEFGSVKKGKYRKRIILNQLSLVISNPFRPI